MGHKTIFLKEIYQGFQIRHQKKLKNNFYVLDLVTFCTILNSQKGYLQILLKFFLVEAKIVLYNIV